MIRALVIEDDVGFSRTLERVLHGEGFEVDLAHSLAAARVRLAAEEPDLVLLDHGLPDGNGLEILPELAAAPWRPVTVMVTGVDSVTTTVEAIRRGAYDYFVKPPELEDLVAVIRRALRERELRASLVSRRDDGIEPAPGKTLLDDMLVGTSPVMREVFKSIARVAPTSANVLVTGESGTGKELVARAIHEISPRQSRPFVAVNCAALSSNLVESELFGHARGSFTGASRDRPGRFELAAEGTLMLDEIGELELELQGKLLRVLEERSFERVGETKSRPFQARLVCATHRDLPAAIAGGRFREDLYFRLRVVEIHLPPLRERGEDIISIAHRMVRRAAAQLDKPTLMLAPEAEARLRRHDWPGNVRELRNVVEQAAVMARDVITAEHLALDLPTTPRAPSHTPAAEPPSEEAPALPSPSPAATASLVTLAEMERDHIRSALEQLGWVKINVAKALGISRPTLDRKIRLYRLEPPRDDPP
jgi:two-component system response regulator AtoC